MLHHHLDGHLVACHQGDGFLGLGGAREPVGVLHAWGFDEALPLGVADLLAHVLSLRSDEVLHGVFRHVVLDHDGVVQLHEAAVVCVAGEFVVSGFGRTQESLPLDREVVRVVALGGCFPCPEHLDAGVDLLYGFALEKGVVVVVGFQPIPFEFFLLSRQAGAVALGSFLVCDHLEEDGFEFVNRIVEFVKSVSVSDENFDDLFEEGLLLPNFGNFG